MIAWFEALPLFSGAVLIVGGFVALSLLFARLVGRIARPDVLREHNDLTGFIFAVVGVVYAVILGFITVGVWDRFQAAEARTYDEASSLISVYRDASGFSNGTLLRHDVRSYVINVIDRGWPALENAREGTLTGISGEILARDARRTPLRNERDAVLYGHMLGEVSEALLDRDARLSEDSTGLNGVMWFVVLAGGFITVAFTSLFGFRQSAMQTAMLGALALLIGMVIFLTMSLDFPFRGAVRVEPHAFERAQRVFDQVDAADPVRPMHR
ncbi:MAG TPA: hypothetical protein VMF11_09530 [Candidatus Baltobacteraceae bacterium]|nr:hypothetical protein [Candidatus Baltobacteraceae bacterium]